MRLEDTEGNLIEEATLRLAGGEVTELLVAASRLEEGDVSHVHVFTGLTVLRDEAARGDPLQRQVDWWLGPLLLLLVVIIIAGVFSIARIVVGALF